MRRMSATKMHETRMFIKDIAKLMVLLTIVGDYLARKGVFERIKSHFIKKEEIIITEVDKDGNPIAWKKK